MNLLIVSDLHKNNPDTNIVSHSRRIHLFSSPPPPLHPAMFMFGEAGGDFIVLKLSFNSAGRNILEFKIFVIWQKNTSATIKITTSKKELPRITDVVYLKIKCSCTACFTTTELFFLFSLLFFFFFFFFFSIFCLRLVSHLYDESSRKGYFFFVFIILRLSKC